jgi:hypothetical protein
MTVPVTRQPNIGNGLNNQTSITLTLFNTILETASIHAELERSWEVVERDISIRERWEARKGSPKISSNLSFPKSLALFSCPQILAFLEKEEDCPLNLLLFLK